MKVLSLLVLASAALTACTSSQTSTRADTESTHADAIDSGQKPTSEAQQLLEKHLAILSLAVEAQENASNARHQQKQHALAQRNDVVHDFEVGTQVCHDGTARYQVCIGSNIQSTCQTNETKGTIYGNIERALSNNLLIVRVSGVSNFGPEHTQIYNNYAAGPAIINGYRGFPGERIQIDPREVYACGTHAW